MRLRRLLTAAVVLTGAATLVLPGAARASDPVSWDAPGTGEFRTWLVDDGELVYTNGVFQARGANTDGRHHEDYFGPIAAAEVHEYEFRDDVERHLSWGAFGVDRWASDGDQELPSDPQRWPVGTGELTELRLQADEDALHVRFRFTSMPSPTAQIATLTLSVGDDDEPAEWPALAGVRAPHDVSVTVSGAMTHLVRKDWAMTSPDDDQGSFLVDLPAPEVDLDEHTFTASIPRMWLGDEVMDADRWVVRGGAGLADPLHPQLYWSVPAGSATATRPGSGSSLREGSPVWSLLFADDDAWTFSARSEGDLLAVGDVTPASITIDPAVLLNDGDVAPTARLGLTSRVHESSLDDGDGIDGWGAAHPSDIAPEIPLDDAAASLHYLGTQQPYGMYVPSAYAERAGGETWPLVVYLHGANNSYHEPFGVVEGLTETLDRRGYLLASVLGRGDLSYRGPGELDVLEVIADVSAHYDVDPDRIYLMGHSMGSMGTHNVATRNPDLFAAVGPMEIATSHDLLVNLRHVPWYMTTAVGDPLDPAQDSAERAYEALADLGYDARLVGYLLKTHESSSTYDSLSEILDTFDRSRRPSVISESIFQMPATSAAEMALGLHHDRAPGLRVTPFDTATPLVSISVGNLERELLSPEGAIHHEELRLDTPGSRSGRAQARVWTTDPVTEWTPRLGAPVLEVTARGASAVEINLRRFGLRITDGNLTTVDGEGLNWAVTVDGVTEVTLVDGDQRLTRTFWP